MHHLLNQLMDFYQTCFKYKLMGEGEELIRFLKILSVKFESLVKKIGSHNMSLC